MKYHTSSKRYAGLPTPVMLAADSWSGRFLLVCLFVFGFGFLGSNVAVAQLSDLNSAAATAEVIMPIGLVNKTPLLFGSVIPTGTAGTVTINANTGGRSASNVDLLPVSADPLRSIGTANFDVSGEPGFSYSITLPGSINIVSGANSMTVDMFTDKAVNLGTLSASGADAFSVGATLHVGATQPPGTYAGTFNATVTYD